MQNNNHLEKEAAEYFADIFSAPAGYPIADQPIDVSAYEDLDVNEATYDPREDLDYNEFMNSLVDPVTGTLRDFRIDDRSLPAAVNFYDYCLNINKGELNIPWARQLIALESFLGEICPYCSNKKYLDPLEVPKDFPPEDLKNPKRLVFLENGVCPICGRTKKHIYHENKFPRYTQGVIVWGQRCVAEDTLLLTNNGLEYIGEIMENQSRGYKPFTRYVYNGKKLEQSSYSFITTKEESLYRFQLADGGIIECTKDHPLMTDHGWKLASTITTDDYIELSTNTQIFGNYVPTYEEVKDFVFKSLKQRPNAEFTDCSGLVSKDFYTLLGLWVSDGRGKDICQKDEVTSKFIEKTFKSIFKTGYVHNVEGCGHYVLGNLSGPFLRFFLGDLHKGSYNQCIPKCVLSAPKEYICAFLKGLYEGDGCIGKGYRIGYGTVSKKLIYELRALMYNLGYHPTVYKKVKIYKNEPYVCYGLDIPRKESKKFFEEIGFISDFKKNRLAKAQYYTGNNQPTHEEHVTPLIKQQFKQFILDCQKEFANIYSPFRDYSITKYSYRSKKLSITQAFGLEQDWNIYKREFLKRFKKGQLPLRKFQLKAILDNLKKIEYLFPAHIIAKIDYFYSFANKDFSKVVLIEKTEPKIAYDLVMPETHRFIGNAIVNHNSGKSSSAASIASYTLHRYLKYPMLAELAPRMMQKSTQLTGIFCSLTFKKAVDVLWIPFRNIILTSEWFNNYFELLEDYKRKTGVKLLINSTTKLAIGSKNMLCFPTGPRASTLRGNTSFMCYLDELGLFPMPKKEEDDDVNRQASPDEAYTSLFNSLVTVTSTADALVDKGYYSVPPSFILSVSSPVSSRDKVMRLLKDAEKDPSIFTSHLPSWEVNPGLWRNKGMIASAFIKDPEKAMRDYGAQPSDIAFGYFNFEDCVKLFTGSPLTHTFKQRVIDDELFCTITKVSSVQYPCVMALDAGLVNNSFSVVVIYYDTQQDKIKTAAIVECMPVKGKTINFAKMYEHVILPLAKDLNVCYVCADRWNSIDLLHRLKHDMGNNPKGKPFTRADTYTLKKKDFEAFKLAIANQSLVLPKLRENEIEEIRAGITGDYRKVMYGRPVNHLLLQMATVIDAGANMCPEKGPGFTDDILRAYVLAVTRLQTEKVSQRLLEFKDYIKTSDPNQAMFVPIVVGRMGLG